MNRTHGGRTRLWMAGFALGGVIAGHSLTYFIAVPDAHARRAALEVTGHGYWPFAVAAGLVALVASFGALARRVVNRPAATTDTSAVCWGIGARLLGLQALAFVALEAAERAFVAGHPVAELTSEPAFVMGLALQIVVAFLGALVIVAFSRAVAFVCARRRHRRRCHEARIWRPRELVLAPPSVAAGPAPLRGPPLSF